ncbi:MAG: 6-bladed beta-propeller [Planctomycetota bacterium]|jgi:hypothetical protein
MKKCNFSLYKLVLFVLAVCIMYSSSGCQQKVAKKAEFAPVFYPPPPNQARMQFLVSYSGDKDFGIEQTGFFETVLLGAVELAVSEIEKPYGVAIHDGKIYVCDLGHNNVKVLDIKNGKFSLFPLGRAMRTPKNIFIEPNGTKYIVDPQGGLLYVYDSEDKLTSMLGRNLKMIPQDVVVDDKSIYITDYKSKQVLIFDKFNGKLLKRAGKAFTSEQEHTGPDTFTMITDLDVDDQGNIYVSDKIKNKVTKFDPTGKYVFGYGRYGSLPGSLIRAKGVAIDREQRIWVVDAGPATAVKVFNNEGQFLMFFGTLGKAPGNMYMPADVCIDYDNVDLFRKYAVEGAELEFIVIVTNQFGPRKVSVYGFGKFPAPDKMEGFERVFQPVEGQ